MKIAAVLPHLEVYGGVRRYLEIGNEIHRRGHDYVLFHPRGEKPGWMGFEGETRPFSTIKDDDFDAAICSEYSVLPYFESLKAKRKFFYFILEGHKKEREVIRKDYIFLGNSGGICRRIRKKYGVSCTEVPGGVNPRIFFPAKREDQKEEFRILCYGRIYKRRKGIRKIIKAVETLYKKYPQLKLVFFDTLVGKEKKDPRDLLKTRIPYVFYLNLPQDRMSWLYSQADVFVSAEKRAGWSNTAAEAMACCVPVVCTKSGTQDFAVHDETALVVPNPHPWLLRKEIKKLIEDKEFCLRLAQAGYRKIQEFTWTALVDRLEAVFEEKLKLK